MKKLDRQRRVDLVSLLSNMKTAIDLLIIVGVISALGTFIPQGQTPDFYLSQYGTWIGKGILLGSLNSLYQSWWYQILIGLLCLSLSVCCYRRLRHARSIKKAASLSFHLAIVIILAGAAWSLGYARSVAVEINAGDKINLANYGFSPSELGLKQFTIDYYPDYQPRQYRSQLQLQGYQGHDYTREISVNHPLQAGILKIYQRSWGWTLKLSDQSGEKVTPLRIKDHDAILLDKAQGLYLQAIFIPDYDPLAGIESKTPLPNNPRLILALVKDDQVQNMAIVPVGNKAQLARYCFRFDGYSYYSGLEIKSDPGVYLVYTGFVFLLIGLIARYWQLFFIRKVD